MLRLRAAFHDILRSVLLMKTVFRDRFGLRVGGGRARKPARRLDLTERDRLPNGFAHALWAPGSAETRPVPDCNTA